MANAINRKEFDRYFTETEEKSLFSLLKRTDHILAKRDLAWMQFLRFTGIRIGVLAGKDIKEAGKKVGRINGLTVGEAKDALRTGYLNERADIAKRGQAKQTFLTKNAKGALAELLKIRKAMGYAQNAEAPLIMGQKGNGLSKRQFQVRFQHWCQQLGFKGSPHWMRHTLAKRIMKNSTADDPRGVVQNYLGHQSLNSTTVYTAPDKEDIEFHLEEVA